MAEVIQVYSYGNILNVETPEKQSTLINVYYFTAWLVMKRITDENPLAIFNATVLHI